MTHFYIKPKNCPSPVKTLCSGVWVARLPGTVFRISSVSCPECLNILIGMEEKRLKILRDNLAKVILS